MANDTNLKPVQSETEAREKGRLGGLKSGEARRRKRDMKNAAKAILEMPVKAESVTKGMKQLGFDEEDLTNQMAVLVSIWKKAMEGDVKAAEFLRDTSGQKPVERVVVAEIDREVIDEVENIIAEIEEENEQKASD